MSSHHTHCIESLHLDFDLPQRRAQLHTSDRRGAAHSELELCRQEPLALEVAPDKTRLIEFGCFAAAGRKQRGAGKPPSSNIPMICSSTGLRAVFGKKEPPITTSELTVTQAPRWTNRFVRPRPRELFETIPHHGQQGAEILIYTTK